MPGAWKPAVTSSFPRRRRLLRLTPSLIRKPAAVFFRRKTGQPSGIMSASGVGRSDPRKQGGVQMTRTLHRLSAWITVIGFGATLSACASSGPPQAHVYAYPARGQTAEQQSRDTYECQVWAKQQTGFDPGMDAAKGAGVGAVIGALGGAAAGAAIGAATGRPGTGAAIGAAAGGLG